MPRGCSRTPAACPRTATSARSGTPAAASTTRTPSTAERRAPAGALGRRPRQTLGLLGLREYLLAGDLPDHVRVGVAHVVLRLLPELVVVLALDDVAAIAVD